MSEDALQPDARPEPFRFEAFADAPSAQEAFEAAYPVGSPIAPALQALVDMGAHLKAVSPTKVACRYVEKSPLAGWCWHVAVDSSGERVIQHVRISLTMLGP